MKKLLFICSCFLFLSACNEDKIFMNKAQIIGFDNLESAYCGCCGGWLIKFYDSDTKSEEYYWIQEKPDNFDFEKEGNFPIDVKINWQKGEHTCSNYIDITEMKLD